MTGYKYLFWIAAAETEEAVKTAKHERIGIARLAADFAELLKQPHKGVFGLVNINAWQKTPGRAGFTSPSVSGSRGKDPSPPSPGQSLTTACMLQIHPSILSGPSRFW